jgi:predicted nucleotide-binding protein
LISSTKSHALRYDIPIDLAAAVIDPVDRIASKSAILPGPIRTPGANRSADRDILKQYLLKHVGRVIVLADEFAPTEPIPLKFERFASSVDGAIALLTPDDVGALAADPTFTNLRARENVWVEVGWFWGHRGREKLLLLTKGEVTIPSDLGNVVHYRYTSSPEDLADKIQLFITKLRSASDV